MKEPRFTWDDGKATENLRKHSISFDEATTVFRDDDGLRIFDPGHSKEEDRFLLLGFSSKGRLIVVSHCYREQEKEIRLISARRATKNESRQYARRKS